MAVVKNLSDVVYTPTFPGRSLHVEMMACACTGCEAGSREFTASFRGIGLFEVLTTGESHPSGESPKPYVGVSEN